MQFHQKQIIWAKVQGSPWWPAEIAKLPNKQTQFYKVFFIGEDTHAFLQPKDVKKYLDNHSEFSMKKSKKLQTAIEKADELIKTRKPILEKQKPKNHKPKPAIEKNLSNETPYLQSQEEMQEQQQTPILSQSSNSTEKDQQINIDRVKIDIIQTNLLEIINSINEKKDNANQLIEKNIFINNQNLYQYFEKFDRGFLSVQQLCQSKVTKMLAYIGKNIEQPLKSVVQQHARHLKDKIIYYLNNTDYYDRRIKKVAKTKQQKYQFEKRLILNLKKQYGIRKQLSQIFAQRISQGLGNSPIHYKNFLKDFKERKFQCNFILINSKVAAQRIAEEALSKLND